MLLLAAASASAQQTCPALNRVQAQAALLQPGAADNLQLAVEWHGAGDYVCTYSAGQATLRIAVAPYHARDGWPSYASRCFAPPGPMAGIGDEAVTCATPAGANPAQQEALGHVRDTYFSIHIAWPGATVLNPDALRRAAEQVAGNL
jgi:hypothetical protein